MSPAKPGKANRWRLRCPRRRSGRRSVPVSRSTNAVARQRDPTAAEIFADLPNLGLRKVIDIVADRICPDSNPQCGPPLTAKCLRRTLCDHPQPPTSVSSRGHKLLEYSWKRLSTSLWLLRHIGPILLTVFL